MHGCRLDIGNGTVADVEEFAARNSDRGGSLPAVDAQRGQRAAVRIPYYYPLPERSASKIALWMIAVWAGLVLVIGTVFYLVANLFLSIASFLSPF